MDRNALHAVEDEPGMPEILHSLPEDAVALLIDTSSNSEEELQIQFRDIEERLADIQTLYPVSFTTDPKLYATYWRVRNGLLPLREDGHGGRYLLLKILLSGKRF